MGEVERRREPSATLVTKWVGVGIGYIQASLVSWLDMSRETKEVTTTIPGETILAAMIHLKREIGIGRRIHPQTEAL